MSPGFPALEEALHSPHSEKIRPRNHTTEESTGTAETAIHSQHIHPTFEITSFWEATLESQTNPLQVIKYLNLTWCFDLISLFLASVKSTDERHVQRKEGELPLQCVQTVHGHQDRQDCRVILFSLSVRSNIWYMIWYKGLWRQQMSIRLDVCMLQFWSFWQFFCIWFIWFCFFKCGIRFFPDCKKKNGGSTFSN